MIWLIGGPARCGKSTLLLQARPFLDGQVLSLDNLKDTMDSMAAESDRRELTLPIKESELTKSEWIDMLRRRDRVMWKVTKLFIEAAISNDDNAIVEGNFWPDFVAELPSAISYKAVFLVDTSPDHVDRIVEIAHSQKTLRNNWMRDRGWSDERLRRWAEYNIARSKEIKRLGKIHSQPVFDVADGGLAKAQTRALNYLKKSNGPSRGGPSSHIALGFGL